MSVENFDGHGDADHPSIIYAFDEGNEIHEVVRSGYGQFGCSLSDVIQRESTRSNSTERVQNQQDTGSSGGEQYS